MGTSPTAVGGNGTVGAGGGGTGWDIGGGGTLVRLTPQNLQKTALWGTSLPQLGQYDMTSIFFSKYKEFSVSDPDGKN